MGTQRVPGAFLHLLVFHPAVEELGVLGLHSRHLLLLLLAVMMVLLVLLMGLKLHSFCRRNKSNRNVALTRGVVAEVDAEGPVAMIYNFTSDEKVELHRLDVGVKVAPAEHLLKLASLDDGPSL